MPNPRLAYLLSRQIGQNITPPERDELLRLIEDPAHDTDLRELLARAIEETDVAIALSDEASRAILLTILQTAPPQTVLETPVVPMRPTRLRRPWSRYVAAAVIVALLGTGAWWAVHRSPGSRVQAPAVAHDIAPGGNKAVLTLGNGAHILLDSASTGVLARQGNTAVQKLGDGQLAYRQTGAPSVTVLYNTLTTPRGGQYQLTLPDGTRVWLNAASSIRFPTAFTGSGREVEITGEAYLEVVHDAGQPFRAKVQGREIEDLGTRFNVNAYEDEP
jgi:transmembrane sensor